MRSNALLCRRHSTKFGGEATFSSYPCFGLRSQSVTRRSGSGNCRGRNRTVLTTLKMAVFAPMPSASDNAATVVKLGLFASMRRP